jgi:cytochrome c oxidase assembly factor CtaG/ferredoxin
LATGLIAFAVVYVRGWRCYHVRDPDRWPVARLIAFLGALATIFIALASPIESFASLLLSFHMMQHLLLMMVVPPLFWLAAPLLPLVRGLPEPVRSHWVVPLFHCEWLRRIASSSINPVVSLSVFVLVSWVWHSPLLYGFAIQSSLCHYAQHACFMLSGLIFWFPVIRPYPYRPPWPLWALIPYLIIADVSNTVLSALVTFSDQVLYIHYNSIPPIHGITALEDQAVAGGIMWGLGSLVYLIPVAGISIDFLFGGRVRHVERRPRTVMQPLDPREQERLARPVSPIKAGRISLPLLSVSTPQPRFDLLNVPLLGRFLRWRYARVTLQVPMLMGACVVVIDGFTGPHVASLNLSGVLVWVVWRGLLILTLLLAGNFFCTACPFLLPRSLARLWLPAHMKWPRILRGKWLALVLLILFFVAYEALALWDRPRITAGIVVGYFVAAFVVDGLFRGASFCKYVCPIGQFNFVQSLASPLELAVRNPAICSTCQTKDCLRGREHYRGCELELFLPKKQGNMDCTFCLDCVHACPHGNVGILAGAADRVVDGTRSTGLGRFGQRVDVAALIIVLVFAAFVNAAGMVGPVLDWEAELSRQLGLASTTPVIVSLALAFLLVLPGTLLGVAAWCSRVRGALCESTLRVAVRFSAAFVPIGLAMWVAHYGYHLATSYDSSWPVIQRFASEQGLTVLGEPQWVCRCCGQVGEWVSRAELLALDVGLLLSLYSAYQTARHLTLGKKTFGAFLPFAFLIVMLFAAGVWIVLQPMQMRGSIAMMTQ